MPKLAKKVGGMRNLIAIAAVLALALIAVLQIVSPLRILLPWDFSIPSSPWSFSLRGVSAYTEPAFDPLLLGQDQKTPAFYRRTGIYLLVSPGGDLWSLLYPGPHRGQF